MVGISQYSVEEISLVFDLKHGGATKQEIVERCKKRFPRKEWRIQKVSYLLGKHKDDERFKPVTGGNPWDPPSLSHPRLQPSSNGLGGLQPTGTANFKRRRPRKPPIVNNLASGRILSPPIREPPNKKVKVQEQPQQLDSTYQSKNASNGYAQQMRNLSKGPLKATLQSPQPMNLLTSPVNSESSILSHARSAEEIGIEAIHDGAKVPSPYNNHLASHSPLRHQYPNGAVAQDIWYDARLGISDSREIGLLNGRCISTGITRSAPTPPLFNHQKTNNPLHETHNPNLEVQPRLQQSEIPLRHNGGMGLDSTTSWVNQTSADVSHGITLNSSTMQPYRLVNVHHQTGQPSFLGGRDWAEPDYNTSGLIAQSISNGDMAQAASQFNGNTQNKNMAPLAPLGLPINHTNMLALNELNHQYNNALMRLQNNSQHDFEGLSNLIATDNSRQKGQHLSNDQMQNKLLASFGKFNYDIIQFTPNTNNVSEGDTTLAPVNVANRVMTIQNKGDHVMFINNSTYDPLPTLSTPAPGRNTDQPLSIGDSVRKQSDMLSSNGAESVPFWDLLDYRQPESGVEPGQPSDSKHAKALQAQQKSVPQHTLDNKLFGKSLPASSQGSASAISQSDDELNAQDFDVLPSSPSTSTPQGHSELTDVHVDSDGLRNGSDNSVEDFFSTNDDTSSSMGLDRSSNALQPLNDLVMNSVATPRRAMSTVAYPTPISCLRSTDTFNSEHHFSPGTHSNQTYIEDAAVDAPNDLPCDHLIEAMSDVPSKITGLASEDINTGSLESRNNSLAPLNNLQNDYSKCNDEESSIETSNDLHVSTEMDVSYAAARTDSTMLIAVPFQTSHNNTFQVDVNLEDAELYHAQPDHERFLSGEPPLNWVEAVQLSQSNQLERKTYSLIKIWNRVSNDTVATSEIKHYSTQKDIHTHSNVKPQSKSIQARLLDPDLLNNNYPVFNPTITRVQYSIMLASHQYQLLQATVRNIGPCTLDNALYLVEAIHINRQLGKHPPITPAEMNIFAHSHSNVDRFGTVKKWTPGWGVRSMEEMACWEQVEEDIDDMIIGFDVRGGRAAVFKQPYWGGKGFFESGDSLYDPPVGGVAGIGEAKTALERIARKFPSQRQNVKFEAFKLAL